MMEKLGGRGESIESEDGTLDSIHAYAHKKLSKMPLESPKARSSLALTWCSTAPSPGLTTMDSTGKL